MKYIDFLNYLKKKNIMMFDYQKRFAYHNLNNLIKDNNEYKYFIDNNLSPEINFKILYELSQNNILCLKYYYKI
uniref:Uncharacterized protein n=1 Tax=Megaviridae environmental sample TaxID=1737588 RepID=A0A5J6VKX0_9VIRU|nr:MAG: hypothetical protein [Megaviridae environmental sample]